MQQQQSINLATVPASTNARQGNTINATPTGSTDDVILRFDNVNAVTATAIAVATTAANGTILTISEPGAYMVDLDLAWTGAVAIGAGIGVNMAAAPITNDPVLGVDGVIKATDVLGVANFTGHIGLSTVIYVTPAQAAAGLTVRFVASNSGNAAPVGLVAASGAYRIAQIAGFIT